MSRKVFLITVLLAFSLSLTAFARPAALRLAGAGITVTGLGEFTLDGHPAVAVGAPHAAGDRGSVTILLDVRLPPGGHASLPHGSAIRIVGEGRGDHFGAALSGGSDVNGDGFPDLIVGAPDASPNGRRHAGAVWVIFGVPAPGAVELSKLRPDQGYEIVGAHAGDHLGAAVASDRDFSGDGHSDLVLGAPGAYAGAGAAYAIDSQLRSETIDLRHLSPAQGFAITGAPRGAHMGAAVGAGGYQNGDAYAEILVGAPDAAGGRGAAYVIWGRPAGSAGVRIGASGFGYSVNGVNPEDHAGAAVAAVGDINHDGYTDIAVGAPNAWVAGRGFPGRPGAVEIVLGGPHSGVVKPAYAIEGVHNGDLTGAALAGGDGSTTTAPQLTIGAPGASFSARTAGAVFVLGSSALEAKSLDLYRLGRPSYRLDGARQDDRAGSSVADLLGAPLGAVVGAPGGGRRGAGALLVSRG
ncbi:MAG TPA: integrin alpha [Solirubrobacteraceae bacterium]|nr:integrin alpha [Solirubrobacteraceae bacterium]